VLPSELDPLLTARISETSGPETTPVPPLPVPPDKTEKEASEFTKHFYAATRRVWVTYALMGLNCLVFLLMGLQSSNLVQPHVATLLDWGGNWGPLTATGGGWWRLLANAFLHFTVFHLLCNMFALWQAGLLAERLFGNWFFLAVYLGAALASSLTSLNWHPDVISAGASGAVFGVYGALLGYLVRQRGAVPRRIWASLGKTILAFVAFNLFYGLTQLKVDNAAHVGGLLAGLLLGWVAARPLPLPQRQAATRPTALQFALTLLLLAGPLAAIAPQARPEYGTLLNNMGETIARGADGPRDPRVAVSWYQRAAQLGSAAAEVNLGQHYFDPASGEPIQPAEGVHWFRQAADHGSTNAEIALGLLYLTGKNIPADHVEARHWIARAADQGVPGEQYLLGQIYYQGDGLPKDDAAAFQWIQRAAEQGLAPAQTQLAAMYFKGEGTATNTVEAARWLRTAADQGLPKAQYILGTLYATGQGVPRDMVEAYAWLSLAAGGTAPLGTVANHALTRLAVALTPDQLAGARHRANELTQTIAALTHPPLSAP
jgi:TPR repeat protein/membrane associated rhomboid family serine protease